MGQKPNKSDADKLSGIGRRELLKAAGAGMLAAGGLAIDATLQPAAAATARQPYTPRIALGPNTVNLRQFATLPSTAKTGAKAQLNFLYHRGDGSGRLYTNDSRGKIYEIDGTTGAYRLFMDFAKLRGSALYRSYYQQGLRSFAFHPDYDRPDAPGFRRFYTVSAETEASRPASVELFAGAHPVVHHNVVAEWQTDVATGNVVIASSRRELFRIAQWKSDHSADQLMFNPNGGEDAGLLFLTVGDGGNNSSHSDPYDQAQNPGSALGKILRFDPLAQGDGSAYGVPADNPFVGREGWLPVIYALGMRHPQNMSFDTGGTGQCFFTDIGQKTIEEVNLLVKGGNYGWPHREGVYMTDRFATNVLYTLPENDAELGYLYPVAHYDHREGNAAKRSAITGGFVYRGSAIPALFGHYILGDIVTGRIFHLPVADVALGRQTPLLELRLQSNGAAATLFQLVGNSERVGLRFGQDQAGELYVLTKQDGKVRKLEQLVA